MKSGWAAAVLLGGSPAAPRVVDSRRVELSDPAIPESRQPYHAGFGTARSSGLELSRLVDSVRTYGSRSVAGLFRDYRLCGYRVCAVGIVAGSLADPARIANAHIRIHAQEGQLFRRLVEEAALGEGLPCLVWRERDLHAAAAATLRKPDARVRGTAAVLGGAATGPWRAEQKAAAVAAWLALATPRRQAKEERRARGV